ncbi:L-threonylcarbamoyladenylate synthase [Fulvivirga lutimaris]|uniref:L-threonylcarbamoyladenylate synthase n=1 Tax=Fulvivirga lutimaris TaxID=1819566 RepID=UPI0012BD5C03|nr:L-threonylcarbamoyladenylate synthase [Fulvivirga lutimaris]MTI41005.1 threonylcarbamoyl-AMP synthase [Fulvivirga lutimaris]
MAEIGKDIIKAKALLEAGQLVAIPTETVYGLAGNAYNLDAVANIFATKNRPAFDPLIVHTYSLDQVKNLVIEIPEKAAIFAKHHWPGPLTLLLKRKSIIPDLVTSGLDTVAVRIPNKELTLELLKSLDFPLVAPSANPFGYISPTSAQHVEDQLGSKIPYILDGGESHVGIESTIIGFENNEVTIHRLGGVSVDEIEVLIGKVKVKTHSSSNPLAPGMLENHYSPLTPILLGDIESNIEEHNSKKLGILSFSSDFGQETQKKLAPDGKMTTAAKNLFAYLRWLDRQPLDLILAELVPEEGLGLAINDRLKRAAAKKTTH